MLQWFAVRAAAFAQGPCIGEGPTWSADPMYVAATDTIGAIVGTDVKEGFGPLFSFLLTSTGLTLRITTQGRASGARAGSMTGWMAA